MRLLRTARLSLRALATHRARTGLAVVGAAVGVAGVLVLTAVGQGARGQVLRRIDRLGRNLLVVTAARMEPIAGRTLVGEGWTQTLRPDDADALVRGSRVLLRAAPAQEQGTIASAGAIMNPTTVMGTTSDWLAIRHFPLVAGRFFTDDENAARSRVAVLGADARASLFADSTDPIGRVIQVGRVPFEVVGVLGRKGVSVDGAATEDDRIIVPIETALERVFGLDYLKVIYVQVASASAMQLGVEEAAAILRARHDLPVGANDDFTIQNQRALMEAELATQASFQRLVTGLGLLSLVVGGVGILSIMLLSVRERRAEIGLRVAVGARRQDIVWQFLAESLILSVAGGALGIGLGVGAAALVASSTAWEARVTQLALGVAIGATVAIGLGFGVIPAWRAARLDPVDALRG
ncbi:MAG TPA: ABC transporter permease [Gemmatimonadaceae bacterium]|nr:ABC transporter permease [Gemmatimonadaceae bacterium]